MLTFLLWSELDAGSVGLALTYSVTLMGMFQWGVRQSAEVENMVRLCLRCHDCFYFCVVPVLQCAPFYTVRPLVEYFGTTSST